MTAKSYLFSTLKEDEEKEESQHGGSGGIYNRQHGGSGDIYNRHHGGSGGKFDDNRTFVQKVLDSIYQKFNITADDRAKLVTKAKDKTQEVIDIVGDALDPTTPQNGNTAKPIVYSDWSPAAQRFGMDQETAYAEHMANTAHQREVADLRAAGLNPVLGAGSGSSGVSGSVAGISSGKKGIDGDSLVDIIGATAGLVTTLVSKKPYLGYMVSDVVKKAGDVI